MVSLGTLFAFRLRLVLRLTFGRINESVFLLSVFQALDLAAEATALKDFKDWWWKARLGKCYYKLGKRSAPFDTCDVERVPQE